MVKIIHCDGHTFFHPTVEERMAGKPWRCTKCKLKVTTLKAAQLLEGRTA